MTLTRRTMVAGTGLLTTAAALPLPKPAPASTDFLWGVATGAHQIEGGNIASDSWLLEHVRPTLYRDPSGDACDSWHRYREDIDLTVAIGCNALRMSVEWARIEPEPGRFSQAALDHYARLLDHARARGVAPLVNLVQFSYPRWFAAAGGFERPEAAERFAAYADRVGRALGDRFAAAATFNEPNVVEVVTWTPQRLGGLADHPEFRAMKAAAERATGSAHFVSMLTGDVATMQPVMMRAHALAVEALRAGAGRYPIGVTLAINEEQGVGAGHLADAKRDAVYLPWLRTAAAHGDFIGVQTYTRNFVGPAGTLPLAPDADRTQAGYEFRPEALEAVIAYVARVTDKPIYITENGVAADDDRRRIHFLDRALASLARARAGGADVRGYFHWTLLDCFEWLHGYSRQFGLVAVNRQTFKRTPKPSAWHYARLIGQQTV
ncbi:glycoside hydrolase family 1 protein [Sphingomonas sanxanigenens]|uniref:Beta-glucosidase n=1 Tax=Sphingomonas sanxanigenens DSM 19645 = NX02 TaxID=1123269 RepID=W0AG68_9SPHN|nr:family 1 glycosylhydrolase [Sphingomonas sanxanigenens]AHE55278.1 hypothetical protein NX02_18045 [Sphingomonas sanxanigenens DSM 19645 = NX02]